MSFLEELKKKKQALCHIKTVTKNADGSVYEEDVLEGLQVYKGSAYGFVVDTKPDILAAHILPGLLMGSQDVALSEVLLQKYNISHVLSLGIQVPKYSSFSYTYIEAFDLPEFNLVDLFNICFKVINDIRKSGGTIYVHCNAGVSRSATVVIGYLMKECDMGFERALHFVEQRRSCIKPNDGFVKQLLIYEKSLQTM